MPRAHRLMLLGALIAGLSSAVYAQVVAGIRFSTIPPGYQYETLGVVTDIQHVPPAILDPTKPFREAVNRLYPELARQAKVVGADMVVISNFAFFPGGQGDMYLQVYGTAIRTKQGSVATTQTMNSAPVPGQGISATSTSSVSSSTTQQALDLSGTWTGSVLEEGENEPIEMTVNLSPGEAPGKYSGGVQVPGKKCDMLITYYGNDGSTVIFNTNQEKGMRCTFWHGQTATPTPDGKLEWKIYTTKTDVPKYTGMLSR